jgi:hypothetical protein
MPDFDAGSDARAGVDHCGGVDECRFVNHAVKYKSLSDAAAGGRVGVRMGCSGLGCQTSGNASGRRSGRGHGPRVGEEGIG